MPEEFNDLPIDGEYFEPSTPKKKRVVKSVRKTVTRRPTARRRASPVVEEVEAPRRERPRISIDTATHAPHKVNVYRRISLAFFGITIVVAGVIAFFTFQRGTIVITQEPIPVAATFPVTITDASLVSTSTAAVAPDTFQGIILSVTTSTSITVSPQTTTDKPGKSHGVVTIYNQGKTVQSLVATTRFLSDGGVLFRLIKSVTAPAGGQVTAEIVADKTGPEGDVAAGNFTIPGLSAANQKIIFGKSIASTAGGSSKVGIVTQQDIDAAKENARKALFEIGQTALTTVTIPDSYAVLHSPVSVQADSSAKPGDETSAFVVTAQGTMAFVAYPKSSVYSAADTEVSNQAPTPYHKVIFEGDAPTVSLQSLSAETKTAKLQVYREGKAVLDAHASAFQPAQFLGRSKQEIVDALSSIKGITHVDISFFPFWVDHAPKVPSRIKVTIQ